MPDNALQDGLDVSQLKTVNLALVSKCLCVLMLVLATMMLGASKPPSTLEQVTLSGELVVLSDNGPTTYYEGPDGYTGFEYHLAQAFADHLGVELRIIDSLNEDTMFRVLDTGYGHFAASGIAITRRNEQAVDFSVPYLHTTPQLLYHAGRDHPSDSTELSDEHIVINGNGAHNDLLQVLSINHPDIGWKSEPMLDSLELMEQVHTGSIDYTVVDSHVFLMNQGLYSQARVAFDLSNPKPLAWAFRKQDDSSLRDAANRFFTEFEQSGELAQLQERYFGHLEPLHSQATKLFARRIDTRLSKYKEIMQSAAEEHELDWHLLAAMSYQESFWNPNAKSPTGVRGLMMLTRNTAKEVGVDNRIDPQQSIEGGALYFASLRDRIPADIQEPDRSWMALAAYNVGMGHLEDARILTERFGGNPDLWHDVKENLPLLQRKKHYKTLKHGYARGQEAATYVQRIRHYYTVLSWHTRMQQRKLADNGRGLQNVNNPETLLPHSHSIL